MPDDPALMRRALEAAALAVAHGGGPFGALVADPSGTIVAVAANDVLVRVDPTAHSEVNAIRRAAAVRRSPVLDGCTLVTTCAPCLMCALMSKSGAGSKYSSPISGCETRSRRNVRRA